MVGNICAKFGEDRLRIADARVRTHKTQTDRQTHTLHLMVCLAAIATYYNTTYIQQYATLNTGALDVITRHQVVRHHAFGRMTS